MIKDWNKLSPADRRGANSTLQAAGMVRRRGVNRYLERSISEVWAAARREGQRRLASAARGGKSEEPEALLGQFKRSDVFIAVLCPGTVQFKLRLQVFWSAQGGFFTRRGEKERKPISADTDANI